MGPLGRLVIIRRTGSDGTHFPLCRHTCLFGRGLECDIRIQLPVVSQQHCKIDVQQEEALLINLSTSNPTQLNGAPVNEPVKLKHGDIITIIDRSFRFESGSLPEGSNSTEHPEQQYKEEPLRQVGHAAPSQLSPEKKVGFPADAQVPPQSTEAHLGPQTFLTRVLPHERKTPTAAQRKHKMSLGSPVVTASLQGSSAHSTSESNENKNEEMSLKRRRVSFGGSLRPELFDENLPPNTPLKRGETPGKRKSLGTPAPTVLKIMKLCQEQSPAPEKGESPSNILLEVKSSSTSNGSESQRLSTPKRKSDKVPSRRKSVDKNTLQIIYPKRRSSSSNAKFSAGKSWADIVKLGTKKQQVKQVKQDAPRHKMKKQRRHRTPQKPLDHTENPFSTGHANSPCTIIIGRAHVDKVSIPARPYRMLNNFILNKKSNYTEDFSGLTEMFKTPGKEKPQRSNVCPDSIKSSEMFEEAKLGEILETWDAVDEIQLPTKQTAEVENISQKMSKQKTEPGETLSALKTWLKASNVSPELVEDLGGMKDQTPTPDLPRKSVSGEEVHGEIQKTLKYTPKSGETPRMSPRLQRNLSASPEFVKDLASMKDQMSTPESQWKSISDDIQRKSHKTPKCTPESGENSRASLRPLRNPNVSPELVEDQAGMKAHVDIPKSPGESISGEEVHRKIRKSPKYTPQSGETPRMSLRLLRDSSASPELVEHLFEMKDHVLTPKSPGELISDEEVHREICKTPKHTPQSGEIPRMSLRLLRDSSISPELVADLAIMKASMQTPEPRVESITGEELHRKAQKTPKCLSKLEETPGMSLRQLRDPTVNPELMEDLSEIKDHMQTPKSPRASISDEEVHKEVRKTPKYTPKSQKTPRMSLRLLRNPSTSLEVMEDPSRMNDVMQTPKSPGESISGEEVHREVWKTPKYTSKSEETPRMSLRLLRNSNASPELVEDLAGIKAYKQTPKSPGESISGEEIHRKIRKTPKCKSKLEETPRMSLRLLRDPSASPELVKHLFEMKDHALTPKAPGELTSDEEVHREICKTPKRTPQSGETPRMSLRLLRDSNASPELVEDLAVMKAYIRTPESPGEPISGEEVHRKIQKTPKCLSELEETPRMSLRQLRDPTVNPELVEDLSEIKDHMQIPKSPGASIGDEKVHKEVRKTPKYTPKSRESPRISLRLLRNPGASLKVMEDLSGMSDHMQTPKSPGVLISDEVHREVQKTTKYTPNSEETPGMALRLLRNPNASPELVEDLAGIKVCKQTPESPGEIVSDEEVHRKVQKTPKRTPKSGETSRTSLRLLRDSNVSSEVMEDVSGTKTHTQTVESSGESVSHETVHKEIQETPKHTLKFRATPKVYPRLLRDPKVRSEVMEELSGMNNHMQTPKSQGQSISDEAVHREIQKTPEHTCKVGEAPNTYLTLLRDPSASSELRENLSGMKDHIQTLESPQKSVSRNVHGKIQKTPKHTPKSGETLRISPRLLRDPNVSPEHVEDLSEMKDHMATSESPELSISDEEIHKEIHKTPKPGETPRMFLRLLRDPSANSEVVENLAGSKDDLQTPELLQMSINGNVNKKIQKTPQCTPRSGEMPRMSPRLCKDPNASPELMEDLAGMKAHTSAPKKPGEPAKQKPELVVRSTGKSPLTSSKIKLEPMETLTLNLLKTSPHTVQLEHQAVNTELRTAPKEEPEPFRGIKKHLRNPARKKAPAEKLTAVKTLVRAPKRSFEWTENLTGLKSLTKTPSIHGEVDSTANIFLTENDSGILTSPEKLQESQLPGRPAIKESLVEDLGPQKLMDVDSASCEETTDSATKNKDGPEDNQVNSSCNPCEDESHTNASENLWPMNTEDSGISQRTRYTIRNKTGQEFQDSIYLPHHTQKVETEMNVETAEPNYQAKLDQVTFLCRRRRRCTMDTEAQEFQLLPSTETIPINKSGKKTLKRSQKKTLQDGPGREKAVSLRSRGRSKTGINLPEIEGLASSAQLMAIEEDEKPMESLQENSKSTSKEKIVLVPRKKINTNFDLVTHSNKDFPAKIEDYGVEAAGVSVNKDEEKTVARSLDKVLTERAATRGLKTRCGDSSPSPLRTPEMADSEEVGQTQRKRHQEKCKELALKQETSVKTRQKSKRLGKEMQYSPSLSAIHEDPSIDKDNEDKRLLDHIVPTQDGRGLRFRGRNKGSTEPEGLLSVASSSEVKCTEEATKVPARKSHQQKETAATEAIPCLRSGRQNKVPITTTKIQGSDPKPSIENTLEKKRADDPSGKVAEDKFIVPVIQSLRLRSRNQTKPEAEIWNKEKPTKKPSQSDTKSLLRATHSTRNASEEKVTQDPELSHSQSDVKSLQRTMRSARRGPSQETATQDPEPSHSQSDIKSSQRATRSARRGPLQEMAIQDPDPSHSQSDVKSLQRATRSARRSPSQKTATQDPAPNHSQSDVKSSQRTRSARRGPLEEMVTQDSELSHSQSDVKSLQRATRSARRSPSQETATQDPEPSHSQSDTKSSQRATRSARRVPSQETATQNPEPSHSQNDFKSSQRATRSARRGPSQETATQNPEPSHSQNDIKSSQRATCSARRGPLQEMAVQDPDPSHSQSDVKSSQRATRSARRSPSQKTATQDPEPSHSQSDTKSSQRATRSARGVPSQETATQNPEPSHSQNDFKSSQRATRSARRGPLQEMAIQDPDPSHSQSDVKSLQRATRSARRSPSQKTATQDPEPNHSQSDVKSSQRTRSARRGPLEEMVTQDPKLSHSQSDVKSLQRATRSARRGPSQETAIQDPEQGKNIIPTKRIRTRR